ncbi:MAG: DUF58 domain-containing protein [Bacteroidetes bacterium]|nr:DUF58 domain-containing protein [Bacteroidota bacterium]
MTVAPSDILKKVRKIEIKTRGISNEFFSGEYHSVFKGRGMSFSEVRQYQYGDDIRDIDWNVTARYNEPYVKIFQEEREMTVLLLIDVSRSGQFGTTSQLKKDYITEIAAVLSFSAISNNDNVGVVFFTDKIEKFIPPKKGKSHILRIIRELVYFTPENTKTNISVALEFLANAIKRRCTAFLLSDFIDTGYTDQLKMASRKHDLVGIRVQDPMELQLPNVGLLKIADAETGAEKWIDTSDKNLRGEYEKMYQNQSAYFERTLSRNGVDFVSLQTHHPYITALRKFFIQREKRR